MPVTPVAATDPGRTDPSIEALLQLLRACPEPLPLAVLARYAGKPEADVRRAFGPLEGKIVAIAADSCSLLNTAASGGTAEQFARCLRSLLAYIEQLPRGDPASYRQAPNVVALAEKCVQDHPDVVVRAFEVVDKPIKATGDWELVHKLAALSISAADREPRTPASSAMG